MLINTINGNIQTLSTHFDNVILNLNDRVLISSPTLNEPNLNSGFYYVSNLGSPSSPFILIRTQDADDAVEFNCGASAYIEQGTQFKGYLYTLITQDVVTIDVTPLQFTEINGLSIVSVISPLVKTNEQLNLNYGYGTALDTGSLVVDNTQLYKSLSGLGTSADLSGRQKLIVDKTQNFTWAGNHIFQAQMEGDFTGSLNNVIQWNGSSNSITLSPIFNISINSDSDYARQHLHFNNDNMYDLYSGYWNGSNFISSFTGGSFMIEKKNNRLNFKYGSATKGAIMTMSDSFYIDNAGVINVFKNITSNSAINTTNNFQISGVNLNTSHIPENTNLYYTDSRFDTRFSTKTTTNLSEGTNLYYTSARFTTDFNTKTTTNLAEGTNLYYTDARWDTRFNTKSVFNGDLINPVGGTLTISGATKITDIYGSSIKNTSDVISNKFLTTSGIWSIVGSDNLTKVFINNSGIISTNGVKTNTLTDNGTSLLIDAVNNLELNSSTGQILIGNDNINQNINIGSSGTRTITIGNGLSTTSTRLECGTGALYIGVNAIAHPITIGNGTGATSVAIETGTGSVNLGVNNTAHAINIGNLTSVTDVNIESNATIGITSDTLTQIQSNDSGGSYKSINLLSDLGGVTCHLGDNAGVKEFAVYNKNAVKQASITSNGNYYILGKTMTHYEENTWTITISGSIDGAINTLNYKTTRTQQFTRIGRNVTVFIGIQYLQDNAPVRTGDLQISGLPYSSANFTTYTGAGRYRNQNIQSATNTNVTGFLDPTFSTSIVRFSELQDNAEELLVPIDGSTTGANIHIYCTLTYPIVYT